MTQNQLSYQANIEKERSNRRSESLTATRNENDYSAALWKMMTDRYIAESRMDTDKDIATQKILGNLAELYQKHEFDIFDQWMDFNYDLAVQNAKGEHGIIGELTHIINNTVSAAASLGLVNDLNKKTSETQSSRDELLDLIYQLLAKRKGGNNNG